MNRNVQGPSDPVRAEAMAADRELAQMVRTVFLKTCEYRYSYNFTWLGRPVIQYPQDLIAMQEIVWNVKPDLIIETGVAHGGSLVFYASLLQLLAGSGRVLGIDVEIRPDNRAAIEAHPMSARIQLVQGSSVDASVVARVAAQAGQAERVMVVLDSNHTHEHVLRELELYSPLVTRGSYLVVFDTAIEDMPKSAFVDRPWGPGNNPATAVKAFLQTNRRFEVDREIDHKLLISVAPGGYLRCVAD